MNLLDQLKDKFSTDDMIYISGLSPLPDSLC